MLSSLFNIDYRNAQDLVRSIVLKSQASAEAVNLRLKSLGIPVDEIPKRKERVAVIAGKTVKIPVGLKSEGEPDLDPDQPYTHLMQEHKRSWKYYLNMAGEYHPSDTMMYVKSLDTLTNIKFDKDTLKSHPITYDEYSKIGDLRKDLEYLYPHQLVLIQSILHPVDIEEAIYADNYQILSYDRRYIASNELLLIYKLQEYIYNLRDVWYNEEFNITDTLYEGAYLAILRMFMVMLVIDIRFELIKTPYVSDWHIQQELNSYYNVGSYYPYLHTSQKLYLYQELIHLRRNAGTESNVDRLIKNIFYPSGLTPKRLDALKLEDRSVVTGQLTYPQYNMADYYSVNINNEADKILTDRNVVALTLNRARDNIKYINEVASELTRGMINRKDNSRYTNIIQVDHTSDVDDIKDPLSKFGYWVKLVSMNLFKGSFRVDIPGYDSIYLSPQEILLLFIYCNNMALGYDVRNICYDNGDLCDIIKPIRITGCLSDPPPTREHLARYLTDKNVLKEEALDYIDSERVPYRPVMDASDFDIFVEDTERWISKRRDVLKYAFNFDGEGELEQALYNNFSSELVSITNHTSYTTWLKSKDLELDGLQKEQYLNIAIEAYTNIMGGIGSNSIPLRERKVIEMVDMLTSYNLLFVNGRSTVHAKDLTYSFLDMDYLGYSTRDKFSVNIDIDLVGISKGIIGYTTDLGTVDVVANQVTQFSNKLIDEDIKLDLPDIWVDNLGVYDEYLGLLATPRIFNIRLEATDNMSVKTTINHYNQPTPLLAYNTLLEKYQQPFVAPEFTTINEKLDVAKSETVPPGKYPRIEYIAVGTGGLTVLTGSTLPAGSVNQMQHDPLDTQLSQYIPFRLHPVASGALPVATAKRYRLRKEVTYGGVKYYAYYLLKVNIVNEVPTIEKISLDVNNKEKVTEYIYTSDRPDLTPLAEHVSSSGEKVRVSVRAKVDLLDDDVQALKEAVQIIFNTTNTISISELAIVSAYDIPLGGNFNYNEVAAAQIMNFVSVNNPIGISTKELNFDFRIGDTIARLI